MLRRGPVRIALAFVVLAGIQVFATTAIASGRHASKASAFGHRALSIGSRGADVKQLQRYLSALGFTLHADGVFGPSTGAAVKAFERSESRRIDGRVSISLERLIKRL